MIVVLRWMRLLLSYCFFCLCVFCVFNFQTSVYIIQQAQGQLSVLTHTQSIADYRKNNDLSPPELENLKLIDAVKKYSIDNLNFKSTKNFTMVYNQHHAPVLWVITASSPYGFEAYQWQFPLVGTVSYKGFFKKDLALAEYHHLRSLGYDVDLRPASAWSTLGWFNDPLLSNMLSRGKGALCNLLFHELFHATYYAPGSVDLNENLANFVAHKATILFLKNDSTSLAKYIHNCADDDIFTAFMLRQKSHLSNSYTAIADDPRRLELKLSQLYKVADSIILLPLHDKQKLMSRRSDLLKFKNAYFIDLQQYESMQDSLEIVFNKIYGAQIKNLVQDLRSD